MLSAEFLLVIPPPRFLLIARSLAYLAIERAPLFLSPFRLSTSCTCNRYIRSFLVGFRRFPDQTGTSRLSSFYSTLRFSLASAKGKSRSRRNRGRTAKLYLVSEIGIPNDGKGERLPRGERDHRWGAE